MFYEFFLEKVDIGILSSGNNNSDVVKTTEEWPPRNRFILLFVNAVMILM